MWPRLLITCSKYCSGGFSNFADGYEAHGRQMTQTVAQESLKPILGLCPNRSSHGIQQAWLITRTQPEATTEMPKQTGLMTPKSRQILVRTTLNRTSTTHLTWMPLNHAIMLMLLSPSSSTQYVLRGLSGEDANYSPTYDVWTLLTLWIGQYVPWSSPHSGFQWSFRQLWGW